MKIRILAAVLALLAAISGCSSSGNAILQTLPYAYGRNPGIDKARLNPNFQYLRVTVSGRVALLALGDVDKHPQGPIQVWYSAEREVLRLQNGRLVGAVGLTTEWRNVILPELPSWSAVAGADQAFEWTRTRDVMPGYRFGVTDELALRVAAAPAKSELRGWDPQTLTWFEERVEADSGRGYSAVLGKVAGADAPLPPSRYAVDIRSGLETVVYGEQCLTADLCFSWQRWPVSAQSSAGQK
ncbi:MAG: YjbF family lipoprotein [Burkholderiales bacterium]|nr:YjbF family lipoprotein [Burkholderiales bacterium]